MDPTKEIAPERNLPQFIESLVRDLGYSVRQLWKAPGFATVSVLSIAIGIGACTALFSIVNGVMLRPLDFPQPQQLVEVYETGAQGGWSKLTPGVYFDWASQQSAFSDFSVGYGRSYNSMIAGNAVKIGAECETTNFFSVFGVRPIIGRFFEPEDGTPGRQNVAILTYQFWHGQFGGRPDVINQTLLLDNQPYTIIGVAPDNPFWHPALFTPIVFSASSHGDYGTHYLWCDARLKSGVSVAQAQRQMDVICTRVAREHPNSHTGRGAKVVQIVEAMTGDVRTQLFVLLGAVGLLLSIACANVAGLSLSRASARQRETAVRSALGASRLRIIRQFLCESLLIAFVGGGLGLLFAYASMGVLVRFASQFVPRTRDVSLDGVVLAVAFGLTLVSGFGLGLVPALHSTRGDMVDALKEAGRGSSGGRNRQRLRTLLVVAEIALALMLLAGAGLLGRSLMAMQAADQGFSTRGVYFNQFSLTHGSGNGQSGGYSAFVDLATDRIAALPSVSSVAFTHGLLLSGAETYLFATANQSPTVAHLLPNAIRYLVTPSYFKTLGIPLVRGRGFSNQDTASAPLVVIINQELAKQYFPSEDPVGKRLMILTMADTPDVWREIVGVVGNVNPHGPQSYIGPQVYEPLLQSPTGDMAVVVKAGGAAPALSTEVRDIFHSLDPSLPFQGLTSFDSKVESSWSRQRFSLVLFSMFSAIALLLAAVGIYGLVAYSVEQRTNEIGVRMALGAQTGDVLRLILGGGARIVVAGLLIGAAASMLSTQVLASLLFNTSRFDPITFVSVAALLACIALVACWLPARRATRIDPIEALRSE
jgi:putative ABC transport system permease protein